ncbi:hypothetical protein ASA1KI_09430 [Opitutales bacterium ASA1]|uniref:6-hydroxymethylpterin diphosphokinase MptE-like protein n=1 Tax=Congregicoccus parvus TaxID=3081749 RepID=UPI002B303C43|nr:hypothetical protein ASA1KI_09430 [Opitutales bacterium ASA1]
MSKKDADNRAENVIVFGCGEAGRRALGELGKSCRVVGFSDNNRALHGSMFEGLPVFAPGDLAARTDSVIIVASMYHAVIRRQLIEEIGIPPGRVRLAPAFQQGAKRTERVRWGNWRAHWRSMSGEYRFRDHRAWWQWMLPRGRMREGHQSRLAKLRNIHRGRPLFIIAAGRSLESIDARTLAGHATATCNGAVSFLESAGLASTYHVIEDRRELERRRREWPQLRAGVKLTSVENADLVPADPRTMFFRTNRHAHDDYFWADEPRPFSRDFAIVAYLGGTITYVMLQLAYHLGADPVVLLGVDHTYGRLVRDLGVTVSKNNRSFLVTPENHATFCRYHFDPNYFRIGERINLPSIDEQERSFAVAADVFAQRGVRVINANPDSGLEVFQRTSLSEVLASVEHLVAPAHLGDVRE